MWSATPTTNWIIVFGGSKHLHIVSDTQAIELSKYMYIYSSRYNVCIEYELEIEHFKIACFVLDQQNLNIIIQLKNDNSLNKKS